MVYLWEPADLALFPLLHYVSGGAEDLGKIIGFDHGIL